MNSNRIRTVATIIAFVACADNASPANAEHSRNGGEDGPGLRPVTHTCTKAGRPGQVSPNR